MVSFDSPRNLRSRVDTSSPFPHGSLRLTSLKTVEEPGLTGGIIDQDDRHFRRTCHVIGQFEDKPDDPLVSARGRRFEGRLTKTLDRIELARIRIRLRNEIECNPFRLILGHSTTPFLRSRPATQTANVGHRVPPFCLIQAPPAFVSKGIANVLFPLQVGQFAKATYRRRRARVEKRGPNERPTECGCKSSRRTVFSSGGAQTQYG
jgi:hypothetical protein